jgi:spore germination cell wall hydrolase CwlJ-like protein
MIAEAVMCMALNLYYEAKGEPKQGQLAVAHVVMNRVNDPNYPQTVCGVIKQKTSFEVPTEITIEHKKEVGFGPFKKIESTFEQKTVYNKVTVCQFSWFCERNFSMKKPKDKEKFYELVELSQAVLAGETEDPTDGAKFFHSKRVKPGWKKQRVAVIGQHIFYK